MQPTSIAAAESVKDDLASFIATPLDRSRGDDERAARAVAEIANDPLDIEHAIHAMVSKGIRAEETSGDILAIMRRAHELRRSGAVTNLATALFVALPMLLAASRAFAGEGDSPGTASVIGLIMIVILAAVMLWWSRRRDPDDEYDIYDDGRL